MAGRRTKEAESSSSIPKVKGEVVPAKKKGKPRGGNSPVIGMNGYNLKEGDNAKFVSVQVALFNMPKVDLDDVDAVAARLDEYFNLYVSNDMKPTVAGMAIALGHNRQWLWALVHNQPQGGNGYTAPCRPEVADLIKKAYDLLENLWESYMGSGKLNPVTGIFLAKNNYGYKDQTEYVVTPNQKTVNDYDADEIRERYLPHKEDENV